MSPIKLCALICLAAAIGNATPTPTLTAPANANGSINNNTSSSSTATIEHDVLHFSYELQQWLDPNVRPCQDFQAYVCGRRLNTSQALATRTQQQMQQNFERFLGNENDEELMDAELKLKHFYVSCKQARSLEDLKSSLMYRQSGGWPAIDDSTAIIRKRRNVTWLGVLSAFHEVGASYFFRTRVEIRSNRRHVLLEPDDTMRHTLRKFEQLVGEVLQQHAVDVGRARLVALEILSFERGRRDLARSQQTAASEQQEMSYEQFKALFAPAQQAEWDAYFRKIVGKPLKANDTMQLWQLPKLQQLFELLQNTTITRLLNWIWIDYLMDKTVADCQELVETYFAPVYQHIVQRSGVDKIPMAQMYSELGRSYGQLLPPSVWIDEISETNSMQMLGRVIHMTLNGDSTLDADYRELIVTNRNFYRNLEKVQRFQSQAQAARRSAREQAGPAQVTATHYMELLLPVNALLQQQQNLSAPLNYALLGEHFAERMIAAGSSSNTPGAWRSMDSDRDYGVLRQCVARQGAPSSSSTSTSTSLVSGVSNSYNMNELVLKLLAQEQAQHAYQRWQESQPVLSRRLDSLLAAGRLQLSLRKLYFVAALLLDCGQLADSSQRSELLQRYLQNSPEFTAAFGCRAGEKHYTRNVCKVL